MDLTEGSETSAKHNLTPGKYPKENIQDSEHSENLKSRKIRFIKSQKLKWLGHLERMAKVREVTRIYK
jgi:hypothetical protein